MDFKLWRVKLQRKYLKGSKNCFELAGFQVIEVKITVNNNYMRQIQGKLVCFELAGNSS